MHSFSLSILLLFLGGKTPDVSSRTYTQIMREQLLKGEESEVRPFLMIFFAESSKKHIYSLNCIFRLQLRKKIQEKSKDGTLVKSSSNGDASKGTTEQRKRGRWDQTIDDQFVPAKKVAGSVTPTWNDVEVSANNKNELFSFALPIFNVIFHLIENAGNRATLG